MSAVCIKRSVHLVHGKMVIEMTRRCKFFKQI